MAGGRLDSGVFEQGGARYQGWTNNIAIANATTTTTNDSIKITGANGTDLGPNNYGWVTLPSTSAPGQLVTFSVTANVTINLTSAHWGLGTTGDYTDYILSVYAINNAGTLKWGVGSVPNHKKILDADDTATATSVTTVEKIFVNSALSADSSALEIGWFLADFDDTGGAAEDLWAVQTGLNEIMMGERPSYLWQIFKPTGTWIANSTYTGLWKRDYNFLSLDLHIALAGAPTAAALAINLPSGFVLDNNQLLSSEATGTPFPSWGQLLDAGTRAYMGGVDYTTTTAVNIICIGADLTFTYRLSVSETAPMTWANNDRVRIQAWNLPIVGWR